MKNRSMFITLITISFLCGIFTLNSFAATKTQFWPKICASCHDGKTAPSKEAMRDKYKTAEAFSKAVLDKGASCMNILKNDKKVINKIANEIGLK